MEKELEKLLKVGATGCIGGITEEQENAEPYHNMNNEEWLKFKNYEIYVSGLYSEKEDNLSFYSPIYNSKEKNKPFVEMYLELINRTFKNDINLTEIIKKAEIKIKEDNWELYSEVIDEVVNELYHIVKTKIKQIEKG